MRADRVAGAEHRRHDVPFPSSPDREPFPLRGSVSRSPGDFNADSIRIQILPQIQSISSGTRQLARWSQAVTGYVFEGQVPYFQVGAIGAGVDTNASAEFALTGCLESK